MNAELILAFETLANAEISVNGAAAIPCVFSDSAYATSRDINFVEDHESPVVVKTSDIPRAKTLIGKTARLNAEVWRINRVRAGAATSILYLISKDSK